MVNKKYYNEGFELAIAELNGFKAIVDKSAPHPQIFQVRLF